MTPPKSNGFFSRLFKMDEQYDGDKVISRYERSLQSAMLTTSLFHDINQRNLDKKNRKEQFVVIVIFILFVPRYFFVNSLYSRDRETQEYFQYVILDYMETLGLLGRCLNVIYFCCLFPIIVDKLFFRYWESMGQLHFVTEMESLKREGKGDIISEHYLSPLAKYCFLSLMHKKLIALKHGRAIVCFAIHIFQVMGCILFISRVSESAFVSIASIVYCFLVLCFQHMAVAHFLTVLFVFHITVDYFSTRVESLKNLIEKLPKHFSQHQLSRTLNCYEHLMVDFEKRNKNLRVLINHMLYFNCPMLSLVLFIYTIDMVWWRRIIILISSSTFAAAIISTELYVGHLQNKVDGLYKSFNSVSARVSSSGHSFTSYTQRHLLLAIRELGNKFKEGQFRVGLTNGKGAAITTLSTAEVDGMTVQFTILLILNIYYS